MLLFLYSFSLLAQKKSNYSYQFLIVDVKGVISNLDNTDIDCNNFSNYSSLLDGVSFLSGREAKVSTYCKIDAEEESISTKGLATCSALSIKADSNHHSCSQFYMGHSWAGIQDFYNSLKKIMTSIHNEKSYPNHAVFLTSYYLDLIQDNDEFDRSYNAAICYFLQNSKDSKLLVIKSYKKKLVSGEAMTDDLEVKSTPSKNTVYKYSRKLSHENFSQKLIAFDPQNGFFFLNVFG